MGRSASKPLNQPEKGKSQGGSWLFLRPGLDLVSQVGVPCVGGKANPSSWYFKGFLKRKRSRRTQTNHLWGPFGSVSKSGAPSKFGRFPLISHKKQPKKRGTLEKRRAPPTLETAPGPHAPGAGGEPHPHHPPGASARRMGGGFVSCWCDEKWNEPRLWSPIKVNHQLDGL